MVKAKFAPLVTVAPKPNVALGGGAQVMDLAGDGQPDIVVMEGSMPGLYEHDEAEDWQPFRPFTSRLNLDTRDPNVKFVDLDGDGHADVLITEDNAFIWHASLAEAGFGPAQRVAQAFDEEKGPRLVFADTTQSIHLADLSGDGLTDLVRIRNGEVCYWPNLGYCRFGAKVTMDNAPLFDNPDQFNQSRIRLADIDGSGTTDIIYLHRDGVKLYFNQSGNSWSTATKLGVFPRVDDLVSIVPTDLLGNGTACLVWSSPLSGDAGRQMRYVNLMGEKKPHLLERVVNNLGAETRVTYAPSTQFYLLDKQNGTPWLSRLPFPVHVVARVETHDHISRNRFVTRYAYHHGYFDGEEREFRGFGMVEQWDTEEMGGVNAENTDAAMTNWDEASFVPPVLTKTWFHTGAYLNREKISRQYAHEYFQEPHLNDSDLEALLLADTLIPGDLLTVADEREACRALKGMMLRQEVYARDATPDASKEAIQRSETPYTVTEQNFTIRSLQSRQSNKHGVFFAHPREAITYHYERNPADPRIAHALTLEVDDYGNVLKSAAIGYGRRENIIYIDETGEPKSKPNPGLNELPTKDQDKQKLIHITGTENLFTRPIDQPDTYRTPLPAESITYEIRKVDQDSSSQRGTALFGFEEIAAILAQAADSSCPITYEDLEFEKAKDATDRQEKYFRRKIEHVRTRYRSDNLEGLLPLGALEPLALPGESYKLAFTPGLLDQVFQRNDQPLLDDPTALLGGKTGDQGGYVDLDNNHHWWIPAGRAYYHPDSVNAADELAEARAHFFLPRRYVDPFGHSSRVDFDAYDLLMKETRDALDNRVTVERNDYRVLQPRLVSDPNRNQTEVVFDALGLVVGTAVMGKPDETPRPGDLLDDSFIADLSIAQIDQFMQHPRQQSISDPDRSEATQLARTLLANATTRIVYDLDRFQRLGEPPFAATIAREIHVSDLVEGQQSKLQISFSFSDGFGREIQKKIQAEKGKAPRRDENGKILVDAFNHPILTSDDVNPRWVGSGWTIFNNKGKPVRQYEPFFTDTHRFEFDAKIGVSPVLFYDPAERVIATLHPNHTYEKVVFDPWQQTTHDVNDTIRVTADASPFDPKDDPDIGGLFKRLPDALYLPTWYDLRTDPAKALQKWPDFDADNKPIPEHEPRRAMEQDAATKAAAHADTPTTAYFDSLARPVLTVARNRVVCEHHPLDGKPDEEFCTRVELDIEGNQRAVRDERKLPDHYLPTGELQQRIVMQYAYDMLGNRIHQLSMEAGERWMLNDVAGKPIRAWDSRGHNFRTAYDNLRRPVAQVVRGTTDKADQRTRDKEIQVEQIEYGEARNTPEKLNLRTRIYRHLDSAGEIVNVGTNPNSNTENPEDKLEAYDFKGNLLRSTRRLTCLYNKIPDWSLDHDAQLEQSETFKSSTRYDALNRPVLSIAPHSSIARAKLNITQPVFNEANLLERVDVWLERDAEPAMVLNRDIDTPSKVGVNNIDYDAKGQRIHIVYKNGAITQYTYDEETFRLIRLRTVRGKQDKPTCQSIIGHPICEDPPETCSRLENAACSVQDLHYTYDPAGNITRIRDDAQQVIYFRNQRVEPSNDYVYDALYRLIQAEGREHLGQAGGSPIPHAYNDAKRIKLDHPGDGRVMGTYTERYVYDAVGNFLQMQHKRTDVQMPQKPGWTRYYTYEEKSLIETGKFSNRLSRTQVGNDTTAAPEPYGYDVHGNMMTMPQLSEMAWDWRDQLLMSQRQKVNDEDEEGETRKGEGTWYVYDASGQRVRKVTERANGGVKDERIYLGGFELYRQHNSAAPVNAGTATLERETLHVMDDKQRIALFERRTLDTAGNDKAPPRLIRYQFGNHLSSASLELDKDALIISYEEYSPYGNTTYQAMRSKTETTKRYRYTGKERDEESGLYYHGARYYAPWIGRWISTDPAGFVDGTNLFTYAKLNPTCNTDESGFATKQQFQHIIATALEKASAGNKTAMGTAAEAVLEGMLQKAGYTILKGPATNSGQHFADIVAYDPDTKELLFFDNKYIAKKKTVSKADAFVDVHDDAETAARKVSVITEARERFLDIAHQLPADQVDEIQSAFAKVAADPSKANFLISNASPKNIKNLVQKISQRLIDRGVKLADASGGSKKLKADIDSKLSKGANATAEALETAGSAGKQLLKSLPAIGLGISAGLAIPRVAQAAEDDLTYEEIMSSLGEEPILAGLSTLRETAVIAGEEGGGELGGWGGAMLGASISWETGPGVIGGTLVGAIIFGFFGDTAGGAAVGYLFDIAADDLYMTRVEQNN